MCPQVSHGYGGNYSCYSGQRVFAFLQPSRASRQGRNRAGRNTSCRVLGRNLRVYGVGNLSRTSTIRLQIRGRRNRHRGHRRDLRSRDRNHYSFSPCPNCRNDSRGYFNGNRYGTRKLNHGVGRTSVRRERVFVRRRPNPSEIGRFRCTKGRRCRANCRSTRTSRSLCCVFRHLSVIRVLRTSHLFGNYVGGVLRLYRSYVQE